jgi:hypothetical protein
MTIPTTPGWYYAKVPGADEIVCVRVIQIPYSGRLTAIWIDWRGLVDVQPVDWRLIAWLGTVPIPPVVS